MPKKDPALSEIYGLAKVNRKWMLTRAVDPKKNTDRTAVLIGDDQNVMEEVLGLVVRFETGVTVENQDLSQRYGKLRVGNKFWLTRTIIATKHLSGVAVTDDEDGLDVVLAFIRGSQET